MENATQQSSSSWSIHSAVEYNDNHVTFKQDEASEIVRRKGTMMYSKDLTTDGGNKSFGCSGYKRFFRDYCKLPPERRNYYEILLENVPCCLHVDCDLDLTYNRDSQFTPEQRYEAGLTVIRRMLKKVLGVEDYEEIVCDSSNGDKFSRHVKFAFKDGSMMKDNYHCGAFMRRVELEMYAEHNGYLNNPHYAWTNAERDNPKKLRPIFDLAIYSKNRSFRFVESAKKGKKRYLVRFENGVADPHIDAPLSYTPDNLNYFLKTLIHIPYVSGRYDEVDWSTIPSPKVHRCLEYDGSEPCGRGGVPSQANVYGTQLPAFKIDSQQSIVKHLTSAPNMGNINNENEESNTVPGIRLGGAMCGMRHSPAAKMKFEELVNGIGNEIAKELHTTCYSTRTFENGLGFMHHLHSKVCPFEGCSHKSNHIKIVVRLLPMSARRIGELESGTDFREKPEWYIKCSDPDCANKRTMPKEIPNYEVRWKVRVDEYISEWIANQLVSCGDLFSFFQG